MTSAREQLIESLKDPAYRRVYVEEHIGQEIAFQLRTMRKARKLTQAQVAAEIGSVQEVISKLEDPDYGRFSLSTLKRMAHAFDVDLIVRFAPFHERVDLVSGRLGEDYLAVESFEDDAGIWTLPASPIDQAIANLPSSSSPTTGAQITDLTAWRTTASMQDAATTEADLRVGVALVHA